MAMQQLGNGLFSAKHYNVALSVREAELAMLRHVGASEYDMLVLQNAQAALCVRENADLYRENADLYRSIFGKDPSEDSS